MVGVLKRLHLHPLEASLNELGHRKALSVRPKPTRPAHPIKERRHFSENTCFNVKHKRVLKSGIAPTKTLVSSSAGHKFECNRKSGLHSSGRYNSKICVATSNGRSGTIIPSSLRTTPVLSSFTPSPFRQSGCFTGPPALSGPKSVESWHHLPYLRRPALSNLTTNLCLTTFPADTENCYTAISPSLPSPSRLDNKPPTHDECCSGTTESTSSMPVAIPTHVNEASIGTVEARPHMSFFPRYSTRHSITNSVRFDANHLPTSDHSACDAPSTAYTSNVQKTDPSKVHRRPSNFLAEPSIHGAPDLCLPRLRNSTVAQPQSVIEFPSAQDNVICYSTMVSCESTTYVTTSTINYYPPFTDSLLEEANNTVAAVPEKQVKPDAFVAPIHVEVPHWRVISFTGLGYSETSTSSSQNVEARQRSPRIGRSLSTRSTSQHRPQSIDKHAASRTLHSPLSRSAKPVSITQHDLEDTGDSAYEIRHSRLEAEEIRRERRLRQRTAEQELKCRLEQKDLASWRKRQQGRVYPVAEYKPDERTPSQLLLPFNQIRRIRVSKTSPVIAFGARVPIPSICYFSCP